MTVGFASRITQIAYAVRDLERSLEFWLEHTKAGPFFRMDVTPHNLVYRGKPAQTNITVAEGFLGDMQIELIRQNDDSPSIFREFLETRPDGGVHHVFMQSEDYDADLAAFAAAGCPVVNASSFAGNRIVYVDTMATLGHFVELGDLTPRVKSVLADMKKAHVEWQGSDPIRPFAALN